MEGLKLKYLEDNKLILFEAVSGSKAYGTATETSDTDTRGVFILPQSTILGMSYTPQINNQSNDTIFYEVKRLLQLLEKNNPNLLELLYMPEECILRIHPIYDLILEHRDKFITKRCRATFGGYAVDQIKKARGLNKKITKKIPKEKKTPLDFCWVVKAEDGYSAIPLEKYLRSHELKQEHCGLSSISHMKDTYALFYDYLAHHGGGSHGEETAGFRGVVSGPDANEVCLSSIPEFMVGSAVMHYNKDGYSVYCKEYKQYWDWVEKRNPHRYNDTMKHGKGYDGKNLGHCHRLLDMAIEIGSGQGVNVRRPNREELLSIRRGEYDYDKLIENAEKKLKQMADIFDKCDLPEEVDPRFVDDLLVQIRNKFQ